MKKGMLHLAALLVAGLMALGLGGCGNGEGVGAGAGNVVESSTVAVKSGSLVTDSWGYTGSAPAQIAAPSGTGVQVQGNTLFADGARSVVSGTSVTKISVSGDITTLSSAAQAAAPPNFLGYVNISVGSAARSFPALTVSTPTSAASGETLKIYSYDSATRKWSQTATAVAGSSGEVAFQADKISLWGIFR